MIGGHSSVAAKILNSLYLGIGFETTQTLPLKTDEKSILSLRRLQPRHLRLGSFRERTCAPAFKGGKRNLTVVRPRRTSPPSKRLVSWDGNGFPQTLFPQTLSLTLQQRPT